MEVRIFQVSREEARERLDRFLSRRLPGLTRSQLKNMILDGRATSEGKALKPSRELKGGERIRLEVPPAKPSEALPEPLPLDILFEDRDILVVNKAPEMITHPGSGRKEGTLVNALLHHCKDLSGIGGVLRPGIVHRLDKGTSGILVVAKNDLAHHGLSAQFQARTVRKIYWALVWGIPRDRAGWIRTPIGRSIGDRKKMSSRTAKGREATTHYRVLRSWKKISLLELEPKTGRTHQLRVHLAELGHPVIGDPDYGKGLRKSAGLPEDLRKWVLERPFQLLHAKEIRFTHPRTQCPMLFEAPLRPEMGTLIYRLEEAFPAKLGINL